MYIDKTCYLADRQQFWAHVTDRGPVVRMGDFLVFTRKQDVLAVLRDPITVGAGRRLHRYVRPLKRWIELIPYTDRPSEHARHSKVLRPVFNRRAVDQVEPDLHAHAAQLIAAATPAGRCEFINDIAVPFASRALVTFLGLPTEDAALLTAWYHDGSTPTGLDLDQYLTTLPTRITTGILTRLRDTHGFTDDHIRGLVARLIVAGQETMITALTDAAHTLATNPTVQTTLRTNPDRIPAFIEDITAHEPPAPLLPRTTTKPTTLGGTPLTPATTIAALTATNHLPYGHGPHRCLGIHLARRQLTTLTTQWLTHIPTTTLASTPTRSTGQGLATRWNHLHLAWPANFSKQSDGPCNEYA